MKIALTILALLFQLNLLSQPEQDFFSDCNAFLLKHVHVGKVDYKSLKGDPSYLADLVAQIEQMDLTGKSENFRLAFFINTYNLLVIQQVVDFYPIQSPLDVSGFFKRRKFVIAGEQLTLDQLEFDKIFKVRDDPRVHFTLGCAAKSCPFLYDNAYTPDHIDEQLNFRTQLIIDQAIYVDIHDDHRTVELCKVFDWYQDQFLANDSSLVAFINKYRFYKVPEDYSVKFKEYDWTLNDVSLE
ncbi:MAG: DUF547 domain-containing protein [Cyclobacteriaceae bacterium]|nr:DUF547 domain-containing protein [Cyclobacteriaceae bacterium HetDA_MAG_MS6]